MNKQLAELIKKEWLEHAKEHGYDPEDKMILAAFLTCILKLDVPTCMEYHRYTKED